ncbi:hypothetical protein BDF22DRAFT_94089 [Syncephalis plumigaleata]|nr:hypothetical protein BDF22DRAFT_94089 [Syncephalis plumigaleata]
MITTIDTKSAWLAVVLLLATNVASQAAKNSTTAVVDISNVAQRLYDPPEDKYSIFKLRQWTQKKEDKAMCAASKNADNLGETLLGLHEEECSISSANQKISYWEIVKDSHVYMIRFAEPRLCLSVTNPNQQATMRPQVVQPNMQGQVPVSNAQAQIPTSNAQGQIPVSNAQGQIPASDTQAPSQQMRLQRRSIGDDFHAPLVHGGHVETSTLLLLTISNDVALMLISMLL